MIHQDGYATPARRAAAKADSEASIERLADELDKEHSLAVRTFECADERRELLVDLAWDAARCAGLDELGRDYLLECLEENTPAQICASTKE